MDTFLTNTVWQIRNSIFSDPNEIPKLIHTGGHTYQLYFPTIGCRFACTMCNYGFGHPLDPQMALSVLDDILKSFPKDVDILVLEASGSFLDEREISHFLRNEILKRVASISSLKLIDIETHYTTISETTLKEICSIFQNTSIKVALEFGVESINEDVLKIYNKNMSLPQMLEVIWQAHKYGIASELNFLLGSPLLSINEQIEDTLNSIAWTIKNCPYDTSCVLFPMNIKKNTLVSFLYENHKYELISHWEFIEMLSRIPLEYVDRVSIAWWGNRFNIYEGKSSIIFPYSCDKCKRTLQEFYNYYYTNKSQRTNLLQEIMSFDCTCHQKFLNQLHNEPKIEISILDRFNLLKNWLQNQDISKNS